MKKFLVYFVIFFVSIFLGNLIANQIFDAIIPHNETLYTTDETPITALKERCSSCFEGYTCIDDFLNVIDTEDEAGNPMVFAVYYRQYEDGETNTFLLIPDKEAEYPFMSYLMKIRHKNATTEELFKFTFSLDEDVLRVSGGDIREA